MNNPFNLGHRYWFFGVGLFMSLLPASGWYWAHDIVDSAFQSNLFYLYLVVVPAVCFSIFGYMVGRYHDSLARYLEKDSLTVLLNQTAFFRQAHYLYQLGTRYDDSLAVIMLDLDDFKSVNDKNNHLVGTAVIKQVAAIIHEGLRETDIAARFGGDEFIICLPRTELDQARIVAERVRIIIESTIFKYKDKAVQVTASFGVVAKKCVAEGNIEDVTECADRLLYEAKELGKNRVVAQHTWESSQKAIHS